MIHAIAGIYASYSDWMPWELDKAKELGLNVIGVIPWGHERISQAVNSRSIVNVHWNADSIVDAIRRNVK